MPAGHNLLIAWIYRLFLFFYCFSHIIVSFICRVHYCLSAQFVINCNCFFTMLHRGTNKESERYGLQTTKTFYNTLSKRFNSLRIRGNIFFYRL